ncbi:transposase [Chitiniphilus eburneus]|uniref:Transposase n=1 Tax=Chitiniphilus eburneus TaxID=2571148 RepID=A0A4U0Q2I8_9NEIS|nr:transposase [Chitiniphilus eburneus]TJZ74840.1 hypothetical protein FAZ21_07745 [Chitiniphilus eburneus]
MSRPRRYTDEQIRVMLQRIEDAVALGETVSRAARMIGISDGLYYKWRQRLLLSAASLPEAVLLSHRERPAESQVQQARR